MSDKLAAANSSALGANMPVVTLPDGSKVQTGTVGALLIHIKNYDALIAQGSTDQQQLNDREAKFRASIPLLKRAGLFDLFTPEEWISERRSAGRKRSGKLALGV